MEGNLITNSDGNLMTTLAGSEDLNVGLVAEGDDMELPGFLSVSASLLSLVSSSSSSASSDWDEVKGGKVMEEEMEMREKETERKEMERKEMERKEWDSSGDSEEHVQQDMSPSDLGDNILLLANRICKICKDPSIPQSTHAGPIVGSVLSIKADIKELMTEFHRSERDNARLTEEIRKLNACLERKESERKEMERKEVDRKEMERKETERKDTERKEMERKIERMELERKEMERKEMKRKEMEGTKMGRKEIERKDMGRKEMKRKEMERKDVERKEMKRKESETKKVERKKMERKEWERKVPVVLEGRGIATVSPSTAISPFLIGEDFPLPPLLQRVTSIARCGGDWVSPVVHSSPPMVGRGFEDMGTDGEASIEKECRTKGVETSAVSELKVADWSVVAHRSWRRGRAEDVLSPPPPPSSPRKRELLVVGLEKSALPSKVMEALCGIGSCPKEDIRMGPIRTRSNGPGTAWVQLPVAAAFKAAKEGCVRVGRSTARVELLRVRPLQCFKCWSYGHAQNACRSVANRWRACYRCGEKGHVARDCDNPVHCVVCNDIGMDAHHRLGGPLCAALKRQGNVVEGVGYRTKRMEEGIGKEILEVLDREGKAKEGCKEILEVLIREGKKKEGSIGKTKGRGWEKGKREGDREEGDPSPTE